MRYRISHIPLWLDDDEAVVRFTPAWFLLYRIAGHLRGQIAPEDYRRLFESIWQDRAANGGWRAEFTYQGDEVVLHLRRAPAGVKAG